MNSGTSSSSSTDGRRRLGRRRTRAPRVHQSGRAQAKAAQHGARRASTRVQQRPSGSRRSIRGHHPRVHGLHVTQQRPALERSESPSSRRSPVASMPSGPDLPGRRPRLAQELAGLLIRLSTRLHRGLGGLAQRLIGALLGTRQHSHASPVASSLVAEASMWMRSDSDWAIATMFPRGGRRLRPHALGLLAGRVARATASS